MGSGRRGLTGEARHLCSAFACQIPTSHIRVPCVKAERGYGPPSNCLFRSATAASYDCCWKWHAKGVEINEHLTRRLPLLRRFAVDCRLRLTIMNRVMRRFIAVVENDEYWLDCEDQGILPRLLTKLLLGLLISPA